MMRPFNITLDIGGMELNVKGNYDPGRPANLKGNPDTWTPAESEELEVLSVCNVPINGIADCKDLNFDAAEFIERWRDQIVDAIEAK